MTTVKRRSERLINRQDYGSVQRTCPMCLRTVTTLKTGRYPNHKTQPQDRRTRSQFPKCPASLRFVLNNGVIL